MTADSVWWTSAAGRVSLPTAEVSSVEIRNRAVGALAGAGFGVLLAAGGLPMDASLIVAPAAYFSGLGALLGALLYNTETYRFSNPAREPEAGPNPVRN